MFEKSCRCGKIKSNFRVDIGPFFIADCCTEAGYDHLGNLKDPGVTKEQLEAVQAPEATANLEIVDEGEQPEQPEVQEETAEEKKARKKAEKAAAKAAKAAKKAE